MKFPSNVVGERPRLRIEVYIRPLFHQQRDVLHTPARFMCTPASGLNNREVSEAVASFPLAEMSHSSQTFAFSPFTSTLTASKNGLTNEGRTLPPMLLHNLRQEWQGILNHLRECRASASSFPPNKTSFWIAFGHKIDMYDGRPSPTVGAVLLNSSKACCWRGCLWYGLQGALNHPLRECKGCKIVRYCNQRCQRVYVLPQSPDEHYC